MNADEKIKFRRTKRWCEFRKLMKKNRKIDPITGSSLTKTFNLHHCSFKEDQYDNLDPENFECLNNMSHDVVHFCFGVPGRLKPWRLVVMRLITILRKMERLNKEDKNEVKEETDNSCDVQ